MNRNPNSPQRQPPKVRERIEDRTVEALFKAETAPQSPVYAEATRLYAAGLNVIPTIREYNADGAKRGFAGFAALFTTRLAPDFAHGSAGQVSLFAYPVNLAVITGRTSGNLTAADCEDEITLRRHVQAMHARGLPVWAWKSGGDKGGGGILFRCLEGTIRDVALATTRTDYPNAGNLELWGNGTRFVLLPPSAHPKTGGIYEWLDGFSPDDQELTPIPLAAIQRVFPMAILASAPGKKKRGAYLHETTEHFLQRGADVGDRNSALFRAACDIQGCQDHGDPLDYRRLWDALLKAAQACDREDEPFTSREIMRTIASAQSEPRTPTRLYRDAHRRAVQDWQRAASVADLYTWQGRAQGTDRRVYLACCGRLRDGGNNGLFRASVREVAVAANVSVKTTSKSLRRLVAAELLERAGNDRLSDAYMYKLGRMARELLARHSCETTTLSPLEDSVVLSQFSDMDLALGTTAALVYRRASATEYPVTVRETANLCNITYLQAWRAWQKLVDVKATYGPPLAVKLNNGMYQAYRQTAEWLYANVTVRYGKHGTKARRAERIAQDRALRASCQLEKAMWEWFREPPDPLVAYAVENLGARHD